MRIMDTMPAWLEQEHNNSPGTKRRLRYFRAMYDATPSWLTDAQRKAFYAVFRKMRSMRKQGLDVEVDHIVPLVHPYVCGLNVPWNLRIIGAEENRRKGNNWWPDCPHESVDWVGQFEAQQLRLF